MAIDRSDVRTGKDLVTVNQPVPMPEGVPHEGVFDEDRRISFFGSSSPRVQSKRARPNRLPIPDPTPGEPEPIQGRLANHSFDFLADNFVMDIPSAPPQPQTEGPLRYVVGGSITEPVKISGEGPTYPEAARQALIEGVVVLECTIATDGKVEAVKVLRGMPLGLSEAAADAASRWRFKPSTINGAPLEALYVLTVRFTLDSPGQVAAPAPIAVAHEPLSQPVKAARPAPPAAPPLVIPEPRIPAADRAQGHQMAVPKAPSRPVVEPPSINNARLVVPAGLLLLLVATLVSLVARRRLGYS